MAFRRDRQAPSSLGEYRAKMLT